MARMLYLIRHGQVEHRFKGKLVGSTNADLAPVGLEQAARLAKYLLRKSPDICFSSPMGRCLQTAEQVMDSLNNELIQHDLLREVDFGEWEGLSFNDIVQLDPEGVEKWIRCDPDFRFPQGECLADFFKRVEAFIDLLLKSSIDSAAVFTHGGIIRFMLCKLLGLPFPKHNIFEVNYADVYVLRLFDNGAVLSSIMSSGDM